MAVGFRAQLRKSSARLKPSQRDEIMKRAGDEALDKMVREIDGLDPTNKIHPNDPTRKKLENLIHTGRIMQELVNEIGFGALLFPGLFLSQDDLDKVEEHQIHDLVKQIKNQYKDWIQEISDTSPMVESLMREGIPKGTILRIETLSEDSLVAAAAGGRPLSYWLSPVRDHDSSHTIDPPHLEAGMVTDQQGDVDQSQVTDRGSQLAD
ncbi:hypothetical protein EDB81DRAFT_769350 [Dactylonectria macrodidyma]|uniref:Uncharacterized protein n=1 Tax=Dactylonectria macrodidyma TaxID=307937 RepID=A0A9P9I5V1_9HYPO|nr:hypothetical protein EDB81DRAFT_769350 [Dactylonectria macrodidyma]